MLGSGHIKDNDYYYYVVKKPMGYQIEKLQVSEQTYILEDADKYRGTTFVEYTQYKATKINWFASIFFMNSAYREQRETIIHIPKNTIVKNYTVDISKL